MRERAAGHKGGNWAAVERSGFTLIELLVVVAIVLILAGGAVPNILGSIQRGRVQTAALQLAQDLRLVRENALLYQADLYFYVSSDVAANGRYYYELLPHLSGGLPDGMHNVPPADGALMPDPGRFVGTDLPFNTHVVSVSSSVSSYASQSYTSHVPVGSSHSYYEIRFQSGKVSNVIPGSPEVSPITVVVGDSGGRTWRVMVDAVGRPRVTQAN